MAVVDVVKYNGGADALAWKFPCEELGTWTQVIVNETQEVLLVKSGIVLDILQTGRHTLNTANFPVLKQVVKKVFGRSPFTAEIWYINKLYCLDVKWGTPSPLQIQDPKYRIFMPVSINGSFGIQIDNAKKFYIKLVGNIESFDRQTLVKYFRGIIITKVKDLISSYLMQYGISALEINSKIDNISTSLCDILHPILDDYGIKLVNFYVNEISVPEDDPSIAQLKNALAKRAEMDILGYNYQQERTFDTLEGAATNKGSGAGFIGAGSGVGIGIGLGRAFSSSFADITREMTAVGPSSVICPKCKNSNPNSSRYCSACGNNLSAPIVIHGNKCTSCSSLIIDGSVYCSGCGRKLNLCPNCKNDIPDGSLGCGKCGYMPTIICPNCDLSNPADSKFCLKCGYRF